jgi:hypothetical protein
MRAWHGDSRETIPDHETGQSERVLASNGLMDGLGHMDRHVGVLKVDCEGCEHWANTNVLVQRGGRCQNAKHKLILTSFEIGRPISLRASWSRNIIGM